jgi:hypothetical protein
MADNFRESFHDEEHRKFDPLAHAVTTIEELHRLGHDGFVYHTSGKVTGMIDTDVDDFLLVTAAGNFPHFQRLRFSFGRGDIDIQVYEATTTSALGTEITAVFNTNRNSANTPALKLYTGPTVTSAGTLVHTTWLVPTPTSTGTSKAVGIVGETNGEEWILAPSTKYLIRITNNSGATVSYSYEALWYELDYPQ